MKYLKKFEAFNQETLDDILDKINKTGYNSLSKTEKEYLNISSTGNTEEIEKMEREIGKKSFKSSDHYFEFEFSHMEDFGDEQFLYGTMYVPSIEFENRKIEGKIEGCIEVRGNVGQPNFEKQALQTKYDILEFCNGLEYEFDNFIQYIVGELLEFDENTEF